MRCISGVASGSLVNILEPWRISPGKCFLIDFDLLIPFSIIGMLYNLWMRSIEFRRRSIFRIRIFQKQSPKIIESKILMVAIRIEEPFKGFKLDFSTDFYSDINWNPAYNLCNCEIVVNHEFLECGIRWEFGRHDWTSVAKSSLV